MATTKKTTQRKKTTAKKTQRTTKDSRKLQRGWLSVGRSTKSKSPKFAKQRALIFSLYSTVIVGTVVLAAVFINGTLFTYACQTESQSDASSAQCLAFATDIIAGYTGTIETDVDDSAVASISLTTAIKKFQKAYSIPATGRLDAKTWSAVCSYGLSMDPTSLAYRSAVRAGCQKSTVATTDVPASDTESEGSNDSSGDDSPTSPTDSSSGGSDDSGAGGSTDTEGDSPAVEPTIPPSSGEKGKPTDATTGPRVGITNTRSGGSISGTFSQTRFTGNVEIPAGAAVTTLTDCVIEGSLSIKSNNLVIIDHCDVNGWFGHRTNNKDPNKQLLIVRHSKFTGPTHTDAVRFANTVGWGDQSTYQNTLVEDTIFNAPYVATKGAHFDAMQFGGGSNHVFNRVLITYTNTPLVSGSGAVSYINNDTQDAGVVFNDLWIEGGGVSYVLRGRMTVNNCLIDASAAGYGYVGGNGSTLNNCYDTNGRLLNGKP